MRDHEAAMCAYAQLAVCSHAKQQGPARDRFLLLCGAAACRAGWLEVAEFCRVEHNAHQPGHRLARFSSFPEAMREPEFVQILDHWERWCSFERAEHLLYEMGKSNAEPRADQTLGDWTWQHLQVLAQSV